MHQDREQFRYRGNRTHRIYFSIDHETPAAGLVSVFHVRYWARKPINADELEELMDDQEEDSFEHER